MTRGRIIAVLLFLVLAAAAVVVMLRGPDRLTHTMTDGTIVTIEAMTFGKAHTFTHGKAWQRWLRTKLPFTAKFLPKGDVFTASTSTQHDALVFWISHYDPKTGQYLDPKWEEFDLTDEHGCKFRINGWGTSYGQSIKVSQITADVFPRRPQQKLRFHMRTRELRHAQFYLENPVGGKFPEWSPEDLPATRTSEELTFTLQRMRYHAGGGKPYVSTEFLVRRNGEPTKDWDDKMVRLMDATGNEGWNYLCEKERAWKVSADFYRTAAAAFAENEIWRIPGLRVPAAGEGLTLQRTGSAAGLEITLVAFAGAGTFQISNDVFTASNAEATNQTWGTSSGSINGIPYSIVNISQKTPFLIFSYPGLHRDERLLIRAPDESGKPIAVTGEGSTGTLHIFKFDKPVQGSEITLEVMVNKPRHAEFIVEPPKPEPRRPRA